jgi:hypothetical protein
MKERTNGPLSTWRKPNSVEFFHKRQIAQLESNGRWVFGLCKCYLSFVHIGMKRESINFEKLLTASKTGRGLPVLFPFNRYLNTSKLRSYFAWILHSQSAYSFHIETTSGSASTIRSIFLSIPWKSGTKVSSDHRDSFTIAFTFRSNDWTTIFHHPCLLVITACLMFIILIERATFSGSSQSSVSGLPVWTQNHRTSTSVS